MLQQGLLHEKRKIYECERQGVRGAMQPVGRALRARWIYRGLIPIVTLITRSFIIGSTLDRRRAVEAKLSLSRVRRSKRLLEADNSRPCRWSVEQIGRVKGIHQRNVKQLGIFTRDP